MINFPFKDLKPPIVEMVASVSNVHEQIIARKLSYGMRNEFS